MDSLLLHIREPSPCRGCQRPHKRAGCHDTCSFFAAWTAEKERIKKNASEFRKIRPRKKF